MFPNRSNHKICLKIGTQTLTAPGLPGQTQKLAIWGEFGESAGNPAERAQIWKSTATFWSGASFLSSLFNTRISRPS
jgi:hypothetical protein